MTAEGVVEGIVPATIFVQWKGTDLCGDFVCECGADGHLCEMFVYSIRCRECGQVWMMPQVLSLVKAENSVEPGVQYWGLPENAKLPELD